VGDDLDAFEARRAEVAGNPIGAALDIGFVFALGANTGDAQKFVQFRKMLVTVSVNKVSKIHERSSGGMSFISAQDLIRMFVNLAQQMTCRDRSLF